MTCDNTPPQIFTFFFLNFLVMCVVFDDVMGPRRRGTRGSPLSWFRYIFLIFYTKYQKKVECCADPYKEIVVIILVWQGYLSSIIGKEEYSLETLLKSGNSFENSSLPYRALSFYRHSFLPTSHRCNILCCVCVCVVIARRRFPVDGPPRCLIIRATVSAVYFDSTELSAQKRESLLFSVVYTESECPASQLIWMSLSRSQSICRLVQDLGCSAVLCVTAVYGGWQQQQPNNRCHNLRDAITNSRRQIQYM